MAINNSIQYLLAVERRLFMMSHDFYARKGIETVRPPSRGGRPAGNFEKFCLAVQHPPSQKVGENRAFIFTLVTRSVERVGQRSVDGVS